MSASFIGARKPLGPLPLRSGKRWPLSLVEGKGGRGLALSEHT